MTSPTPKLRFATVWLAGCSGCHMSFLDLDEWLFELAAHVDVVFSPVASDIKEFPEGVDVCPTGAIFRKDDTTGEKAPHRELPQLLRTARDQHQWLNQ